MAALEPPTRNLSHIVTGLLRGSDDDIDYPLDGPVDVSSSSCVGKR